MDPTQWSDWLKEGYFISYQSTVDSNTKKYFFISRREFAHYEFVWPETITDGAVSGPHTITDLENTSAPEQQLWQMIFGINKQVYIYTHVPTDVDRHGISKRPKQTASLRQVGHYDGCMMSPWDCPSWTTEHFLIRPDIAFIAVSAYLLRNRWTERYGYGDYTPIHFDLLTNPVKLNFFIAKCDLEKIGEEVEGRLTPSDFPKLQAEPRTGVVTSTETGNISPKTTKDLKFESRYYDVLEALYRRQIPQRPITLTPVRAPATAT